jgi:ABC-2 type transport system permease protein
MIANQLALIRREIWEHRSIYITPAAIALVVSLLTLTGQVSVSAFGEAVDLAIVGASNVDEDHRRVVMMAIFGIVTSIFSLGAWIVMVFYSLDALYAERKDKSILFWRSLPITDAETVVSKLITALLVIPLAFLAAVIATHLVILILTTIWIEIQGGDAGHLLWSSAPFFDAWAAFLIIAIAYPLWLAPLVGWFLFVSAYAKRSPLLIASLPLIIVPMLEKMLVGSHLFWDAIFVRTFRPPLTNFDLGDLFDEDTAFEMAQQNVSMLSAIDLVRFITSPSLWAGLIVCGLLTAAAVYVRRYRDES